MKINFLSKVFSFVKHSSLWTGIMAFFLLLFGIAGIIFASFGVCFVCTVPLLTFFFGIFGLSMGFLVDYNYVFLGLGLFFMCLTVLLFVKKKKHCHVCQVNVKKK